MAPITWQNAWNTGATFSRAVPARVGQAPVAGADLVRRTEGLSAAPPDLGAGKPVRDHGHVDEAVAHWLGDGWWSAFASGAPSRELSGRASSMTGAKTRR